MFGIFPRTNALPFFISSCKQRDFVTVQHVHNEEPKKKTSQRVADVIDTRGLRLKRTLLPLLSDRPLRPRPLFSACVTLKP